MEIKANIYLDIVIFSDEIHHGQILDEVGAARCLCGVERNVGSVFGA
jgi:hypothetical protein